MSIELISHQIKPADELYDALVSPSRFGRLIIGDTGVGKSYVVAAALRKAQDNGYLNDEKKPYNIFMLVPKKAITQHRRVFHAAGIKSCNVTNHSALAASEGALFIDWIPTTSHGSLAELPSWTEDTKPAVIIVDECQLVKSITSARTQIILAAIRQGIKIIFVSATPFQKASEAAAICLGCGIVSDDRCFRTYSYDVSNGDPSKNSPAAIRRIREDLEAKGALIRIKGARFPFKPEIKKVYLTLQPDQKPIYDAAWEDYLETCRKRGWDGPAGIRAIWVAKNKYREVAELLKAPAIAARAFQVQTWPEQPRQILVAACFVATLEKVWSCLTKIYGINPNNISVLYGGQSDKQAQQAVDDFNEGRTKYFLTTMKSGGTSLSLDHQIVNPLALPRYVILGLSWSCYEMVQVLGRCVRIKSASKTIQEICAFQGTVEQDVITRLEDKFDCLRELIERKESFISDVFNRSVSSYIDQKVLESLENEENSKDKEKEDEEESANLSFLGESTKEFGDGKE